MPRANRYFLPGHVWHITHRCHKREFLLKFARDRKRWCYWLYQAKKRYGLCVLNYIVTSNHIHLLVCDQDGDSISKSMQLIAGRTAQEYNQRKRRKGAYWEDRYFATAIDSGAYLARCLAYIDLNMVRAGVVDHPREWRDSGYHEIQSPPHRYRLIDRQKLADLLECSLVNLATYHQQYTEQALLHNDLQRQPIWSESVAVGSQAYTEKLLGDLAYRGGGRQVSQSESGWFIKEPLQADYKGN